MGKPASTDFNSCRQATSGFSFSTPGQKMRQARADAVDIEGGDLDASGGHGGTVRGGRWILARRTKLRVKTVTRAFRPMRILPLTFPSG